MNIDKILKYIIWSGFFIIAFIPLIVGKSYFFPFIVPKTLVFRIVIEVIFLAFLGLAIIKKEYRPKLNLVLVLFFLYILTVFVSSVFNDSLYFSFWSNNERSEGILLLVHLFLFLIVASGFFRKAKEWLILFDASFLSSLLVSGIALAQYFDMDMVAGLGTDERLTSTIGNAGYVAGYLIFNIFFGLLLFFFRKNKKLRWYYSLGILLQIFVVLNTLTRGGILALTLSLGLFAGYVLFSLFRKNKLIRNSGTVAIVLVIIFFGLVFTSQEADWVKDNTVLDRVASISFESTTAQNRLMTWNSAWQGFKEKPILGYGYENFYQPFDKYFNPKIFRHSGSVVWFDRAHSIVFDRLITGGLIGLFLYLAMLFLPLYFLWKYCLKDKQDSQRLIAVVFSLIILSYFIQNLFIFEALVTYIPLFLGLAFLAQYCPSWAKNITESKKTYIIILTISIVAFLPALISLNIKPAVANKELVQNILKTDIEHYNEAYDGFINLIEKNTPGNQEYRQHFAEFVEGAIGVEQIDEAWKKQAAVRVEQELERQIQEKPQARNYLLYMRFLNKVYRLDIEKLDKAIELFEQGIVFSPARSTFYTEVGYTQIYRGLYYQSQGETAKASQSFDQAVANMQKTIDLNDQVIESYVNMIMILLAIGQDEQIQFYYDRMNEVNKTNFKVEESLKKIADSAVRAQNYSWVIKTYQELVVIDDSEPNYWTNLALGYAYMGNREKAIETAEKIKEFGPDYTTEAENFINDIEAGKFKQSE